MHLDRFGEADRFPGQTLDACAQRQMFPLNLLRVPLARAVDFRGEVPLVRAPIICVIARDTKRLQQGLQLQKDLVLAPAQDIRQDLPTVVINGMPEPPLCLLLANKTPHFVDFGLVHTADHDLYDLGI